MKERVLVLTLLLAGLPLCGQVKFDTVPLTLTDEITVTLEVGDYQVPEHREKENSYLIQLKVARIKAKSPDTLAPVLYLAGGPGGSAINDLRVPSVREMLLKLNAKHDIILIDQRGTGNSSPKLVWQPNMEYRLRNSETIQNMFSKKDAMLQLAINTTSLAIEHFKNSGIDITAYNSLESAKDIFEICSALGYKKVNLLGFSYGTHLALATAKYFPSLIRSMVLVGTEGLNHTYKLPETYNKQIKKLSNLSSDHPYFLSNNVDFKELLEKVLDRLDKKPLRLPIMNSWTKNVDTVVLGKFGFQFILRMDLGDDYDFVWFPKLLIDMEKGEYEVVKKFVAKRYNQLQSGVHLMSLAMNISSGSSEGRRKEIIQQAEQSLLGNVMNFPEMDIDYLFRHLNLGDSYRSSIPCDVPTLFVSGSLDCNAPVEQAEEIRKDFVNGIHLKVINAGHESMLPNEEVQNTILGYVEKLRLTKETIALPEPKFLLSENQ